MPTRTGLTRPRAGLGLASNMPARAIEKHTKPARNRTPSTSVKSAKPAPNRVARRDP
jgi:hypothetical protein